VTKQKNHQEMKYPSVTFFYFLFTFIYETQR